MPVTENTTGTAVAVSPVVTGNAQNRVAGPRNRNSAHALPWKPYQRILFRIGFVFFISLCIPNTLEWYKLVLHIDWTRLHYRDLYDIARFGSGIDLFGNKFLGSTLLGYANWVTTLLVAVVAGLVWTAIVRARKTERKEYNLLYYWLRVIVRYRAGIGIIGFGFTKLLPVQMPYPSLGLLNTNFGDLTAQKVYWLSIGIVPWYQIFAGVVEVAAGTLLLFRKTTTLGALLLFSALGDIVYVNFAYDGGVHVYSSYFVLLAAFLLVDDTPRLYNLLIRERVTVPVHFYPAFPARWQRYLRVTLKSVTLFVFLILLFYLQLVNFLYDPYKQPSVAGVRQLRGNYTVEEFRINNRLIPYSPLDSTRWQEVTFEKWSSLTYTVNRPVPLDLSNGGGDPQRDVNRTFEVSGVGGGRRVFHYYADTISKVLYLEDKYKPIPDRRNKAAGAGGDGGTDRNLNPGSAAALTAQPAVHVANEQWISSEARAHIGSELTMIDKRAASTRRDREFAEKPKNEIRKRMVLQYNTSDGSRIVLNGVDENKDSVYIVLRRIDRKYALSESSLQAGKYE
jgi:hypothetical protein